MVEKNDININTTERENIKNIEQKLCSIRKKRIKPFFDDKSQTDLNSYWIYSILHSSFVLDDDEIYNQAINYYNNLKKILSNNFKKWKSLGLNFV